MSKTHIVAISKIRNNDRVHNAIADVKTWRKGFIILYQSKNSNILFIPIHRPKHREQVNKLQQ